LLARALLEGNESLYLIAYDCQTKLEYHQIKLKNFKKQKNNFKILK
jgi:hypothetical protein